MKGENPSIRRQFCHAASANDNRISHRASGHCGSIHGDGIPDADWCSETTDLWWGMAFQFPAKALEQIALSGRSPSRAPGMECPIPDCRVHADGREHEHPSRGYRLMVDTAGAPAG